MTQSAIRLFVRSLITEAKDKKAEKEPKKAVKKDIKNPEPKKAKKNRYHTLPNLRHFCINLHFR